MTDELLDLVNEKDVVIGTVSRSETINDVTKIHREVAVVVTNSQKQVLLQRRSLKKAQEPGRWTVSAAGHVGAGENPKDTAERELSEEIGIDLNLKFVGKRYDLNNEIFNESRIFWVYTGVHDGSEFALNEDEVMGVAWAGFDEVGVDHNAKYQLKEFSYQLIEEVFLNLNNLLIK